MDSTVPGMSARLAWVGAQGSGSRLAERRIDVRDAGCDNGRTEACMRADSPSIIVVDRRIPPAQLARLVALFFEDMVKYVVDLRRGVAAAFGEMHADAELILIESGSRQTDLWGANYFPGRGRDACIEYTSLINIRPSDDNRSMYIQSAAVRESVKELTNRLLGEGEPLP